MWPVWIQKVDIFGRYDRMALCGGVAASGSSVGGNIASGKLEGKMGWKIVTGGKEISDLATMSGWSEFQRWIHSLDASKREYYPVLHFADHSWYDSCGEMLESVKAILGEIDAGDVESSAGVRDILNGLVETLGQADPDSSAFFSDGVLKHGEDDSDE